MKLAALLPLSISLSSNEIFVSSFAPATIVTSRCPTLGSTSTSLTLHKRHILPAPYDTIKNNGDNIAPSSKTSLSMGLFDFIQNNFLDSREGDFIPLEKSDTFGPGPLILAYAVPESMDTEELKDMVEDGMPGRSRESVIICRIKGVTNDKNNKNGEDEDNLLDMTVEEALNKAMKTVQSTDDAGFSVSTNKNKINPVAVTTEQQQTQQNNDPCPVLYFSGVTNSEMMETYQIIANEIYEETNGVHWPACAKVVPPAMNKSMRRVLEEISGDHADAMRMRREEAKNAES